MPFTKVAGIFRNIGLSRDAALTRNIALDLRERRDGLVVLLNVLCHGGHGAVLYLPHPFPRDMEPIADRGERFALLLPFKPEPRHNNVPSAGGSDLQVRSR